jgi:UDP-3-O-[3-hydroxymyristoyl] glucosamine N-acyltransferase
VGVADHIHIGDRVIATAQTGVGSNVEDGAVVSGSPAVGHVTWLRASALFAKLPELLRRVRDLERRVGTDK